MTVGPSAVNNANVDNKCMCPAHGFDEPEGEVFIGVIVGKESTTFLVPREESSRRKVKVHMAVRWDSNERDWEWCTLDETVDLDADVEPNSFWKKFDIEHIDNGFIFCFTCSSKDLQFEEVKNIVIMSNWMSTDDD